MPRQRLEHNRSESARIERLVLLSFIKGYLSLGMSPHRQNKGSTPFGIEPSASDFAMLPLPVYKVSLVRLRFSHHGFLKQLHHIAFIRGCLYGKALVTPAIPRALL